MTEQLKDPTLASLIEANRSLRTQVVDLLLSIHILEERRCRPANVPGAVGRAGGSELNLKPSRSPKRLLRNQQKRYGRRRPAL
jgi:hypothetical protein